MRGLRLFRLCRLVSVVARDLRLSGFFRFFGFLPFVSFFSRDRVWRDQPSPGRSSNQNPLDLQAMEC